MAVPPEELHDQAPPTPAPADLVEKASELVRRFPQCFWFGYHQMLIRSLRDVRLVIERLREYGDSDAWSAAQLLHKRLSLLYKRRSS